MNLRHKDMAAGFVVSIAASTITVLTTAAQAAEPGTRSVERLLNRDTNTNGTPSYDNDGTDFDILTGLLQAVLADTPDAPVAIVTDGTLKVTGFLPTDAAFARTGGDIGLTARNEERLAAKYENTLGLGTVGTILAYHFVPDGKLNAADLVTSDGIVLDTAASQTTSVNVARDRMYLKDKAPSWDNARITTADLNRGNVQVAHAVNRVMMPLVKLPMPRET